MHSTTNLFALLTLISAAAAATHNILVGKSGFTYSPNSTTAAKDDTVVFHFYPGDHNVVQGDFNSPCSTSGGFYSGYIDSQSGAASQTFTITINDTNPIWIYCSQVDHCQSGMVMVINPPSSGDTLSAYAAAAAKTSTSTTPANAQGGRLSGSGPSSSSSSAVGSVVSSAVSSKKSSSAGSSASAAGSSASSAASSSASPTPASSSASQTSTSSTTSASASATKNSASVVGNDVKLSGITSIVALVAFWIGLI